MKQSSRSSLVIAILLVLVGVVQGAGAQAYSIYDYVYEHNSPHLEITARIPQLSGALDLKWQEEFNLGLKNKIFAYLTEVQEIAASAHANGLQSSAFPYEAIVQYEVKLNRGGLLSLAILSYSFTGGAHGMTFMDYVNVDLTTGHAIHFNDVFNTEQELIRAADIINANIAADPDRFFVKEFTPELFDAEQGFYLQEGGVVVCFGLYELAPYVAGIQEFLIPTP